MSRRGTFKYVCEDCDAEVWLGFRERQSRHIPRCDSCGSTFLNLSKGSYFAEKNKDILKAMRNNNDIVKQKMNIR